MYYRKYYQYYDPIVPDKEMRELVCLDNAVDESDSEDGIPGRIIVQCDDSRHNLILYEKSNELGVFRAWNAKQLKLLKLLRAAVHKGRPVDVSAKYGKKVKVIRRWSEENVNHMKSVFEQHDMIGNAAYYAIMELAADIFGRQPVKGVREDQDLQMSKARSAKRATDIQTSLSEKYAVMYQGEPGCGKTYRAISDAESFTIAVPCRQLAYEIYMDYPDRISRIDTGEIHKGDSNGNRVCVFENLPFEPISQDTLIIDECHYINDPDRGGELFEKIILNMKAGKNLVLLTATDTVSHTVKQALNVKKVKVEPFASQVRKVELELGAFCKRVRDGMRTIVFSKYAPDDYTVQKYCSQFGIKKSNVRILSANTPSYERVKRQLDFKNGNLQVIIATNVLAQGLNFPAEGVLIEYNQWDNWEIVMQKKGRVARPLSGLDCGYFCLRSVPMKRNGQGIPETVEKPAKVYVNPDYERMDIAEWGFSEHEIPSDVSEYSGFKYSQRFLRELKNRGIIHDAEQKALNFLEKQGLLLSELLDSR